MQDLIANQIFDSSFANGAYSHSFGLETFIRLGFVCDENSFFEWLNCYLMQNFLYQDALGFLISYENFSNLDEICKVDEILTACTLSSEIKNANRHIALSSISSLEIFDLKILNRYENMIKAGLCFGHSAVVFAIACATLGIGKDVLKLYCFSNVKNLSSSATRAIPLGQKSTQRILKKSHFLIDEIYNKALKLEPELLGCGSSVLELSCFMHERLEFRLFMS